MARLSVWQGLAGVMLWGAVGPCLIQQITMKRRQQMMIQESHDL